MIIADSDHMLRFGRELSVTLVAGDWVAIDGPLGAGKTVLCAGILNGLGYAGEVASPSYAIVHSYDPPDVTVAVAHVDLYRINRVEELNELGLAEERGDRITLVEWAGRAGNSYTAPTHLVTIMPKEDGTRMLNLKTEKDDNHS
jgi:tRNA threonylcarbamoyladenosine biosynthesis protein TsaE